MEAKYYTPSLEEFYIGFEYEYFYSPLRYKEIAKSNFWEKRVYTGKDFVGVFYPEDEDKKGFDAFLLIKPYPGNFLTINEVVRVKFLDAQDIEECGFKNLTRPDFTDFQVFNKEDWWIDFYPTGELEIAGGCDTEVEGVHFIGKVKNKSELKKILLMLNIK